jgi:hypothetical protein
MGSCFFLLTQRITWVLLPGVPKDLLKDYSDLKAYRNSVATLDAVAAFYAKETDDIRAGFKPDA